ncbi:MAG: fliW [Blastococcus sp.]|jgi:flagellar assembly factor FliW|nr:fliW [Blastococcus sp.]
MASPSVATLPAPAPTGTPVPLPVQVLAFAEPLPGFPGHRDYVLVPADAAGLVFWLQSVAPAGPRFLAVPAADFFPDYVPSLPGAACVELGLEDAGLARLLCLVTIPDGDVASATANLLAPVVVNPATSQARQVVLTDGRHPIRRPLRR